MGISSGEGDIIREVGYLLWRFIGGRGYHPGRSGLQWGDIIREYQLSGGYLPGLLFAGGGLLQYLG